MKLVLFVCYVVCILQYLTLMCIYLLQLLSIRESIPPLSCFLSSCSWCRCLRPRGQVLIPFLKSQDFFSPQLTTSHLIFSVQSFEDCGFYIENSWFHGHNVRRLSCPSSRIILKFGTTEQIFSHCCSPCFHLVPQSFPLFSQVKRLYFVGVNVDPSDGSLGLPSAGRPTAFWGWPRICPCDFVFSLTFVSNMCIHIYIYYYYILYVHINKYMLHTYAMERERKRYCERITHIYIYIRIYIYVYIYIYCTFMCADVYR